MRVAECWIEPVPVEAYVVGNVIEHVLGCFEECEFCSTRVFWCARPCDDVPDWENVGCTDSAHAAFCAEDGFRDDAWWKACKVAIGEGFVVRPISEWHAKKLGAMIVSSWNMDGIENLGQCLFSWKLGRNCNFPHLGLAEQLGDGVSGHQDS